MSQTVNAVKIQKYTLMHAVLSRIASHSYSGYSVCSASTNGSTYCGSYSTSFVIGLCSDSAYSIIQFFLVLSQAADSGNSFTYECVQGFHVLFNAVFQVLVYAVLS